MSTLHQTRKLCQILTVNKVNEKQVKEHTEKNKIYKKIK